MVFGVTLASLVKKLDDLEGQSHQIFHDVYQMVSPIVAMFFVLIGLTLDLSILVQIGFLGVLYVASRTIAKTMGASVGAHLVKADSVVKKYLGPCLYSQAGVALGLAVVISEHFASFGSTAADTGLFILNTITTTTILFQIFGPLAIKWAIDRSGEAGHVHCEN